MAGSSPGPTARRVAANLKRVRQEQGLGFAELARRLEVTGHRIGDTGLLKIEKGERDVKVDDLAALAVALGTTPNRLLLPDMAAGAPGDGEITPKVAHPAADLWAWASGEAPLGHSPSTAADDLTARGREVVFSRENRQHLWNSPAPGAPASRAAAASRVFAVAGVTALIQEAFLAGMSTTDIRAALEGAIVTALMIPDPATATVRLEIGEDRVAIRNDPREPDEGSPEAQEEQ